MKDVEKFYCVAIFSVGFYSIYNISPARNDSSLRMTFYLHFYMTKWELYFIFGHKLPPKRAPDKIHYQPHKITSCTAVEVQKQRRPKQNMDPKTKPKQKTLTSLQPLSMRRRRTTNLRFHYKSIGNMKSCLTFFKFMRFFHHVNMRFILNKNPPLM